MDKIQIYITREELYIILDMFEYANSAEGFNFDSETELYGRFKKLKNNWNSELIVEEIIKWGLEE